MKNHNKWGTTTPAVRISSLSVNRQNDKNLTNQAEYDSYQVQFKQFEDEIMGHKEGEGQIGDSIERNMNQMVDVLRSKINAIGNAARTRMRLCEEDLKKNSKESSDQAPKMMEDFDESANHKGMNVFFS